MLEVVLERLENPRRMGDGRYMARCPAHDDRHPSLQIKRGEDGRVLLHCFAGCKVEEVCEALGIELRELTPGKDRKGDSEVVKRYAYHDERNEFLYEVVRLAPKGFCQRRPDTSGGWIWDMKGVRRVLYRLPSVAHAIAAGQRIYVCEGEKDADRLYKRGLAATTAPGGAGKWKKAYSEMLRGAHAVLVPDADAPGRTHAREAGQALLAEAASVKLLDLYPGVEDGRDVSDWLDAGGSVEQLEALADQAAFLEPDPPPPPPAAGSAASEEPTGDSALAETLARLFKDRYRWAAHRKSWMVYRRGVWRPVEAERVAEAASRELRGEYARGMRQARDRHELDRFTRRLHAACSHARIQSALSFLKGMHGFLTLAEEWDASPYEFNVLNGVVDLREGELRPHTPRRLDTMQAGVAFNPRAEAPAWEAHLERFLPDMSVRRQLQRDMGVAMAGAVLEEALPIWYGSGGNGKTTTAQALRHVFGDYARRAAPDLLIQKSHREHPTEIADLAGARFILSVESGDGKRLAEKLVKELSGGDTKKARFMNCDFFEFEQTFSIVLLTNHKPAISGGDEGIWRRVRLVPWTVAIDPAQQRPQSEVLADLKAEGSGILRWCLHGLAGWWRDPNWIAPDVAGATADYRADSDWLAAFIEDCLEIIPSGRVSLPSLYQAYCEWCAEEGRDPVKQRTLSRRLKERGFAQTREYVEKAEGRSMYERAWRGVRLRG